MAQEEIIKVLEECGEAMTLKEIAKLLKGKVNQSAIVRALAKLSKYGEIKVVRLDVYNSRHTCKEKVKNGIRMYSAV